MGYGIQVANRVDGSILFNYRYAKWRGSPYVYSCLSYISNRLGTRTLCRLQFLE